MKRMPIKARLEQVDAKAPDVFASFLCDGAAMVGLAHIRAGTTDHFWERHGNGDEILYLFEGRATFTAVHADGRRETIEVAAGDLLLLGRNEAHQAQVRENLRLLFVTPQDGNVAWTDDPTVTPRH